MAIDRTVLQSLERDSRRRVDTWLFLVERAANSGLDDGSALCILDEFTRLMQDETSMVPLLRVLGVETLGDLR